MPGERFWVLRLDEARTAERVAKKLKGLAVGADVDLQVPIGVRSRPIRRSDYVVVVSSQAAAGREPGLWASGFVDPFGSPVVHDAALGLSKVRVVATVAWAPAAALAGSSALAATAVVDQPRSGSPHAIDVATWREVLAVARSCADNQGQAATEGHPPAPAALVLRCELAGTPTPVVRRLAVPASWNLAQLHVALQAVMGWEDRHLHQFEVGGRTYERRDPEALGSDETRLRLGARLKPGERFLYNYDVGYNWWLEITVEAAAAEPVRSPARLIEASGAAPPEDVGGVEGFAHFTAVMADPQHPEHTEMADWYGGDFAAEQVDAAAITEALRTVH